MPYGNQHVFRPTCPPGLHANLHVRLPLHTAAAHEETTKPQPTCSQPGLHANMHAVPVPALKKKKNATIRGILCPWSLSPNGKTLLHQLARLSNTPKMNRSRVTRMGHRNSSASILKASGRTATHKCPKDEPSIFSFHIHSSNPLRTQIA